MFWTLELPPSALAREDHCELVSALEASIVFLHPAASQVLPSSRLRCATTMAAADEGEPVQLYVYDLSRGLAKQFAPLVGLQVSEGSDSQIKPSVGALPRRVSVCPL